MPKELKEQAHGKIYSKVEERNYREEMRRQQEKHMIEEFARAYGYDVNKHQPHANNGEIDVDYPQAHVTECRAKEEQLAKQMSLAKQKEALKGKMNAVTQKKPQPKPSTDEVSTTEEKPSAEEVQSEGNESKPEEVENAPIVSEETALEEDDFFERDEEVEPMTRAELEYGSQDSV